MTRVEDLIKLAEELPEDALADLLDRARQWAAAKRPEPGIRPVRIGGMATGFDVTPEDLRAARSAILFRDDFVS